jgi:hypothetical protein
MPLLATNVAHWLSDMLISRMVSLPNIQSRCSERCFSARLMVMLT